MRILVTGGAGFIGSHIVDLLLERGGVDVTCLDNLTYAGNLGNIARHEENGRFTFVRGDVVDPGVVSPLVSAADRVVHAAAESFVDRSIDDPNVFARTNVVGTQVVLDAAKAHGRRVLYVSTDEVYGSVEDGSFAEDDGLQPNSPYAATKAGGDLLCRAYFVTYGLDVTVVRGSNAYGPRQHPEKALPTWILSALGGRPLPVYGDGSNRREWLFVRDFAAGVLTALDAGEAGRVYNIGGGQEMANLDLARLVAEACRRDPGEAVEFVPDRPGHDFRYSVSWERLADLGWTPRVDFRTGLEQTIAWYRDNPAWWRRPVGAAT